jgi:hypothetical protein
MHQNSNFEQPIKSAKTRLLSENATISDRRKEPTSNLIGRKELDM